MKLRIKGTYRHRLRINLLFFTIALGWKTDSFDKSVTLNDQNQWTGKFGPVDVTAKIEDRTVTLDAGYLGVTLFSKELVIPPASFPIHSEPVKGCILNAVLSLE